MADLSNTKDITTVDSTPSVAITDKIYINKGGKLQQVSLATAIESKIDSSLSKSKFAADAKATKDAISKVDSDIKAQNPISETIFSNTVTFSPTAYGNAIPEQIEGDIRQDTTKGLQLFDANRISDYSAGGVTLRNNKDGSLTISGSGELTGVFSTSYTLSHEDSIKLFPAGNYQITRGNIYPSIFLQKRVNNVVDSINSRSLASNYLDVTEEDVANESYVMQFVFYGTEGTSIVPGTIKPMAWASTEVPQDADWEPYTGGQPSPNPDYPQIVHGVGDMGFFDGELVQGAYRIADGSFGYGDRRYISNANKIPCHQGDMVTLQYDGDCNGVYIHFYKQDNSFIQSKNVAGNKVSFVAPTGTGYCNITIYKVDSIFVASAKHITVTINDKYAVCVKSKGKNLLDFEGFLNSRGSRYTKCGDRYRITGLGSAYSNPILLSDEDEDFTLTGSVTSESGNGYSVQLLNNAGNVVAFIRDDTKKASGKGCKIRLNYVGEGAGVYEDIMVEKGTSHDKYIPYQSTTTYIPVDYPLFEGDKIVRSNGEYKLLRKWNMKTYDGTETGWFLQITNDADINNFALPVSDDTMENNGKTQYSNILKKNNAGIATVTEECFIVNTSGYTYVRLKKERIADLQSFKTYLAKAPITIAVQRSTPTEEPLSSEAMKALYSIMACDEETELTIVGVPSDAEIQNQFLLPRNEDGALNTTAYCTAKRNEIALEELENATAARLSALETQALQEV